MDVSFQKKFNLKSTNLLKHTSLILKQLLECFEVCSICPLKNKYYSQIKLNSLKNEVLFLNRLYVVLSNLAYVHFQNIGLNNFHNNVTLLFYLPNNYPLQQQGCKAPFHYLNYWPMHFLKLPFHFYNSLVVYRFSPIPYNFLTTEFLEVRYLYPYAVLHFYNLLNFCTPQLPQDAIWGFCHQNL